MKNLCQLTKRNILVFLRDRVGVAFSLLAPLIVLLLFVLFLGDIQVDSAMSMINTYAGPGAADEALVEALVNSWMVSGVLGVGCLTVAFSAVVTVINDRETGVNNDYVASPIKKTTVYLAYFLGTFIVTTIIMLIVLACGLIFLACTNSFKMDFVDTLALIGIVILGCASSSLIVLLLTALIKTQGAHGALFGIISAISGFLLGAYMPVSTFPKGIQYVCGVLPGSHIAGLCRNELLGNIMDSVGAQSMEAKGVVENYFSVKLNLFGNSVGANWMLYYVLITTVIFIVVDIIFFKKAKLVK